MDNLSARNIMSVPVDKVQRNPFQPREAYDEGDMEELANSVRTHGIIQPVILRKLNDNYQLVAGERRFRAAKMAGLTEIPAVLMEIDGIDVAEVSLIENIQRKDLNCIEEGKAYDILIRKFGLTQEEVSNKVGKSRPHIANSVRLLGLPEKIIATLQEGKLTEGHGRTLLGLPTQELKEEAMKRVLEGNLSVRQTEILVRNLLAESPQKRRKKRSVTALFVDARIYFNSIKKALNEIRESGGKADMIERETEDYLEILIRIPKADAVSESISE